MNDIARHDAEILDQFTRQANPFADHPANSEQGALRLARDVLALSSVLDVLDVACGPGLLAVALAPYVRHVTGIDFVPAMIERARREQAKRGLDNLRFEQGDARALPHAEGSFDRVISRFSFHHLQEPARVLAEMSRVCKPGGRVAVIDGTPRTELAKAFDEIERLRDPSHAGALPRAQLERMFDEVGLARGQTRGFSLPMAVDGLLGASFPRSGDAERVRARLRADADDGVDRHALAAHYRDGALWLAFPCSIVVGDKPA